jgi:homoserine dehydrogenase
MTKGPRRVALLGAGTVGAAVIRSLQRHPQVEITAALVRDVRAPRDLGPRPPLVTADADEALDGAEVVVELIGGVERPTELMQRAVERGARLVSANKAALAERWDVWGPWAAAGRLGFEASVMAGTPVVSAVAGPLRGSRPLALHALLNGTCGYLIERMEAGEAFDAALAEAQRRGYAEADPALDVDGIDAAHKLTLLARLCALPGLRWERVREHVRGIRSLTPERLAALARRGLRARLVASLWSDGASWRLAVRPAALPAEHPLVRVGPGRSALLFRGDDVGEVLIAGPGAGGEATASAVVADVLEAAAGRPGPAPLEREAPPGPAEAEIEELPES